MRKIALAVLVVTVAVTPVAGAATRDRTRPTAAFTTADGAVIVSTAHAASDPALPTMIRGTAKDSLSGIKSVTLYAIPCNTQASSDGCSYVGPYTAYHRIGSASVTCNSSRRSCSWAAHPPTAPGTYWVAVTSTDKAGNRARGDLVVVRVV